MNVLVVIDVQNCFMFHKNGMDEGNGGTFLNVSEEQVATDIVNELDSLVKDKTHVVFSRDFHPVNHISLEGYEDREIDYVSIWPKHCRNKTLQCKSRIKSDTNESSDNTKQVEPEVKNNIVDTDTGTVIRSDDTNLWNEKKNEMNNTQKNEMNNTQKKYLEVIGTELSYMFFKSDIFRDPVRNLIINNRKGENKIGLNDTANEEITTVKREVIDKMDEERKIIYGKPLVIDNRKYISLTKGERCDKEAYSAFNYHIQYKPDYGAYKPKETKYEHIKPNNADNSTGLWEWILNNRENQNEITVTVCGLVGNVCVMHSLLQGIALWNNVYSKNYPAVTVKFVYSLKGTRFAVVPKSFSNVKPDFVNDNVVVHFNKNLPAGMQTISLSEPVELKPNTGEITSFEVLGYDGNKIKIGTFDGQGVNTTAADAPADAAAADAADADAAPVAADVAADAAAATSGGMHRRSIRRRKNKSRKSQKRQKGRRTHKNKRRYTKRR